MSVWLESTPQERGEQEAKLFGSLYGAKMLTRTAEEYRQMGRKDIRSWYQTAAVYCLMAGVPNDKYDIHA